MMIDSRGEFKERTMLLSGDVRKDLTNLLKIYKLMPEFGNILLKAENSVVGFVETNSIFRVK